ncbi:tRNA (cytidine(34)-2'-O)-methyltransferase [Gordonia sp. Z-3]|jgi:tRNA (cytidine/uridine-2'-O-)-methyltransferase|uniref:Putative tRNA (cytidine(34)-2'-O)-methyltransferase n=1 Tax=Gordonia tangerina TaxID=2911060 RepID=A0ABS9DIM6_9ACTN|nr:MULTISPECIES: tRNA (cytidine(34)-2'-O)-methyltransferase [Gordonia]MAU83573.1 tRNA (uridine(34)/cytosine(34)/5-carboxymethylaminomethyluridine(34)-2'-O)-methyltransferase TrmL [Gordonia sp. (in: high G+C Gram-positive bacteria)]MCF3939002.1 tRNA (cytidine(34)-2'-O)-methyltransferase [Gordonia tangerina]MED5801405.1 tRNA (cytidine(34)-2'-O)-methyltransferase [Gordonia sp. Z-3]
MFRIMFYQPCIPPNTGNAIRLAANTGCELHLIEPLGFDMSDAQVKRAGLDYHEMATVTVHPDLTAAWETLQPERVFAFTAHTSRYHTDVDYRPGDVLLFGPEPTGLSDDVLDQPQITDRLRIPMLDGRRSHNLANAASIVVYEAWRQNGFTGAV